MDPSQQAQLDRYQAEVLEQDRKSAEIEDQSNRLKNGDLGPILEMLEKERQRAMQVLPPEDMAWPYRRAFQDGGAAIATFAIKWIKSRLELKVSPDAAKNTESE